MVGWNGLVDLLRATLFALTHVLGGSTGGAIAVLAVAVRALLLPLTVRLAVQRRALQTRRAALEPELARLRARHGKDFVALMAATDALHKKHGIPALPKGSLATLLVQAPILGALYRVVRSGAAFGRRFLWIADLNRPDPLIALLAAGASALAAAVASSGNANSSSAPPSVVTAALLGGVVTLFFVWRVSAGVGVYWAASSVVGVVEGAWARRIERRSGGQR